MNEAQVRKSKAAYARLNDRELDAVLSAAVRLYNQLAGDSNRDVIDEVAVDVELIRAEQRRR